MVADEFQRTPAAQGKAIAVSVPDGLPPLTVNTQPLLGPPVDNPKLKRSLSLKASFTPVPVTLNTLDGLLVDFWDAKEPE